MPQDVARHCRAALCIGECAAKFTCAIEAVSQDAGLPVTIATVPSLEEAVTSAFRLVRPGDTVLFSPGAPSFDVYKNFAERGDHFVRLVNEASLR